MIEWLELNQTDRRILERLYGGGSLRNCDSAAVSRLRHAGLIEGKESCEALSPFGRALLDYAHADLKERLRITANG